MGIGAGLCKHEPMPGGKHNQIEEVVRGIQGLQNAYSMERKVFLGGVVLGILLITFFSIMTAFGKINRDDWVFVFGPPGLFSGMCMLAMTYFGKSLDILKQLAGGRRDE